MPLARTPLILVVSALATSCFGCNAPDTVPMPTVGNTTVADQAADRAAEIAALRARGREGLTEALARYDAAEGEPKANLARLVDGVAGQRHAIVSRLYWHTDLDAARAEAKARGVPILSLRMLGRLDEDASCANSRFFRVVLYADETVSAYLREHVVLHWSSERPVPHVSIDFGDGRVVRTTLAGNSAHYVLDVDGRPVDVLPGLYGPETFLAGLDRAAALARETADLDGDARAARLSAWHSARMEELTTEWQRIGSLARLLPGLNQVLAPGAGLDESLAAAERLTFAKGIVELPLVESLGLGPQVSRLRDSPEVSARIATLGEEQVRLGRSSRALLASLAPADWGAGGVPLEGAGLEALIARFEQSVSADTMFNEVGLHHQVHGWFANGEAPATLAGLNTKVYADLFLTPATDPWLGIATPGVFSGLPGDGIEDTSAAPRGPWPPGN